MFLVCVKADRTEKLSVMVISLSRHPKLFGPSAFIERGFDCHSNSKAWMNTELFFEWLHRFGYYIRKTENRMELVFPGNIPYNGYSSSLPESSNITVQFLPKSTKSRLQPVDAGFGTGLKRS